MGGSLGTKAKYEIGRFKVAHLSPRLLCVDTMRTSSKVKGRKVHFFGLMKCCA